MRDDLGRPSGRYPILFSKKETRMKSLIAVLSLAVVAVASGCASSTSPMLTQATPWPSTMAPTTTPWMTAQGCDPVMANRMGKRC